MIPRLVPLAAKDFTGGTNPRPATEADYARFQIDRKALADIQPEINALMAKFMEGQPKPESPRSARPRRSFGC